MNNDSFYPTDFYPDGLTPDLINALIRDVADTLTETAAWAAPRSTARPSIAGSAATPDARCPRWSGSCPVSYRRTGSWATVTTRR